MLAIAPAVLAGADEHDTTTTTEPEPTTTTTEPEPTTTTTEPEPTTTTTEPEPDPTTTTTTTEPEEVEPVESWDDGLSGGDYRTLAALLGVTCGVIAGGAVTGRRY